MLTSIAVSHEWITHAGPNGPLTSWASIAILIFRLKIPVEEPGRIGFS